MRVFFTVNSLEFVVTISLAVYNHVNFQTLFTSTAHKSCKQTKYVSYKDSLISK